MSYNAANVYKKNSIDTAGGGELIVMLYEGAIRFLNIAIDNIGNFKKYDVVNTNILKCSDIINELRSSLDMKVGDLAVKLDSIYDYCLRELMIANTEKRKDKLIEVRSHLSDLLVSWKQVANNAKQNTPKHHSASGFSISG